MSVLLTDLKVEYKNFFTNQETKKTPLQVCLNDTKEFKAQLKKLKAHLNKHIQETKELNSKDNDNASDLSSLREKLDKRHTLIQDKLIKSHKQWDFSIKKQSKLTHQQYMKFNKSIITKLKRFDLDEIYNNKIAKKYTKDIENAIGSHIARYYIRDLPVRDKDSILKYLQNVYNIDPTISEKFIDMGQTLNDLKNGNFESCLKWTEIDQEDNSSLMISRLRYQLYLLDGLQATKSKSLEQVCKYFIEGMPRDSLYDKDIEFGSEAARYLTQLIITSEIENIDLLIEKKIKESTSLFTQEYCSRNRLPNESSLFLILLSGVLSSQYFIKYAQIKSSAHVGWTTTDELPFDVELPDFLTHFHPVFICPVLKEETTNENPPYSLFCHHVISKKALDKLSKNGTMTFKCPYCPVQSTDAKTTKVNFIIL